MRVNVDMCGCITSLDAMTILLGSQFTIPSANSALLLFDEIVKEIP